MFQCKICSDDFTPTDEVVSTNCGHIFHKYCLEESMRSNASCPQCRSLNPTSHQIFLGFEESTDRIRELEASLEEKDRQMVSADESHALEVSCLETQLERNEKVCMELQERVELLRAQRESEEQQNILKAIEIHDLQGKLQALVLKSIENEGLQNTLRERDSQLILKIAELNDLTQKVRVLTEYKTQQRQMSQGSGNERMYALIRECAESTEMIRELNLNLKREAEEKAVLLEQKNTLEEKLKQMQLQRQIRHSNEVSANPTQRNSTTKTENKGVMRDVAEKTLVKNEAMSIPNGVIIKGLIGNFSPIETVLKLAQKMQLCVAEDDIEHTEVNRQNNDSSLAVAFKNKTCKDWFLAEAAKLKYYPETRHLEICAFSATTNLLAYAKRLKSVGFQYFYIRNNFVFARLDNKSPPIKIFDKEAVDKMISGFDTKELSQTGAVPKKKTHAYNGFPNNHPNTLAANRQWRNNSEVRKPPARDNDQLPSNQR